MHFLIFVISLYILHASAQTSLPVFTVQTTTAIQAPVEKVWDVLLDFEKYSEWNPFVRSQILTNELFIPNTDQSLAFKKTAGKDLEGSRLIIRSQIPPIPLPANSSSIENLFNNQISLENITLMDPSSFRMAWKQVLLPDALLNAERLTTLSGTGDLPLTIYSSSESFSGLLAPVVRDLFGPGLTEGFNRQGEALKARVESGVV